MGTKRLLRLLLQPNQMQIQPERQSGHHPPDGSAEGKRAPLLSGDALRHHESRQPQQGIPDELRRGRAIRILGRGSALLHAFPSGDQDVHRHLERIQRRFRHVLSDRCSGHRGVPERDGRHQGTPRTTRQLLPRVVPAVAELHRLRARHVHREQTPFPPHQVRKILRGERADTDTRFHICQPRRSRRISHLQAHQRHAGDSGYVLIKTQYFIG